MTVERDNDENRSLSADCGLSAAATQPLASEAPPNSTALQQQDKPEPQRDDPERYTHSHSRTTTRSNYVSAG
jgi:hypothetical protein